MNFEMQQSDKLVSTGQLTLLEFVCQLLSRQIQYRQKGWKKQRVDVRGQY